MKVPINIFHQFSEQLLHVTEEYEVYQIMSEVIKKIIPGIFFIITKLQPDDMNFRIVQSSGLDKYFNSLKTLIGKDLLMIDFPFKKLSEEQLRIFESRKLYHFQDGIYGIANGVINKDICKAVEKMFDISGVYAISFCVEKKYYGGISFFIPSSILKIGKFDEEIKLAIEAVSNQTSIVINKLRDQAEVKKKDDELLINQAKFYKLVSQLTDIVWEANADGSGVVDLSNSFEKYYGYSSHEFIKNTNLWVDVIHPEDKKIAKDSANELYSTGSTDVEYRIVRPDGKIIWLHDRKSLVYDNEGNPLKMGGIASDITERKLLKEKLLIRNYALNDSPTAIGLAGLDGIMFYANNAYVKLWGYDKKDDVIGKHVSEFAVSSSKVKNVLSTIRKGEIYHGEGESIRIDGSKFYCLISARLIKVNNKPYCLEALFVDITEMKKTETKLNEFTLQLKELNNTKDRLFSIIAHDLRSPFNAILGFTGILTNNYNKYSDEERLKFIKIINKSVYSIFNLLNNILDWSRSQLGHFEINNKNIDLKSLVTATTKPYYQLAFQKEIQVINNIENEIIIKSDEDSLKVIIRNLFMNAIKFTNKGGRIEFKARKTSENVECRIKDTGVGMSPETIKKLFRNDENISMPGTKNEKGTGLGLILCKELIEKIDGEINVESELGKGSIFKILLPV